MKTYKRRLTIHVDADNLASIRAGLTRAMGYLSAMALAGRTADQKKTEDTATSSWHVILKTTSQAGEGDQPAGKDLFGNE